MDEVLKRNNMEKVYDKLKQYFNTTPKEQLQKDWEKLKKYNEIGPTVEEYLNYVKQYNNDKQR